MQVTELLISSFPEGNLIIQKTLTFQVITENKKQAVFLMKNLESFQLCRKIKLKKKYSKANKPSSFDVPGMTLFYKLSNFRSSYQVETFWYTFLLFRSIFNGSK